MRRRIPTRVSAFRVLVRPQHSHTPHAHAPHRHHRHTPHYHYNKNACSSWCADKFASATKRGYESEKKEMCNLYAYRDGKGCYGCSVCKSHKNTHRHHPHHHSTSRGRKYRRVHSHYPSRYRRSRFGSMTAATSEDNEDATDVQEMTTTPDDEESIDEAE